ncbi:GNAT family N-acetyltransferase [Halomontanus rarus]|uniref:GNAT family N-acetyltransferase n=1 Tax=Halomontanus rarus TaxID=3034020 RepID=UPI001A982502
MEVREAVPADADAIRHVHVESITELGREAYAQEQVDAWAAGCRSADYTASIEADDSVFVVAEDDGDVAGFASLEYDTPDGDGTDAVAEITGVYVHPAVARRGVGSKLYAALERRARGWGAETLELSASLNAVPFYESLGYERVGRYSHEFSSHESTGVEGDVVEMRTEL